MHVLRILSPRTSASSGRPRPTPCRSSSSSSLRPAAYKVRFGGDLQATGPPGRATQRPDPGALHRRAHPRHHPLYHPSATRPAWRGTGFSPTLAPPRRRQPPRPPPWTPSSTLSGTPPVWTQVSECFQSRAVTDSSRRQYAREHFILKCDRDFRFTSVAMQSEMQDKCAETLLF